MELESGLIHLLNGRHNDQVDTRGAIPQLDVAPSPKQPLPASTLYGGIP
jgi:hypothetical protein